jgi:hypothetical protein
MYIRRRLRGFVLRKLSTLNMEDSKADKSDKPIVSAVCLTKYEHAIPRILFATLSLPLSLLC